MSQTTAWVLLVASGPIDVAWAYATKRSESFADWGWACLSLLPLAAFIGLLTKALEVLPLGTAYAVWTGIGAVGSVLLGIVLPGEPMSPARLGLIAVVMAGVVGLKLTS